MGNLLIRDVDERLMQHLKAKAEINRTSLQLEAKKALERGAPLTGAERKALLDRLHAREDRPRLPASSASLVRELREEEF